LAVISNIPESWPDTCSCTYYSKCIAAESGGQLETDVKKKCELCALVKLSINDLALGPSEKKLIEVDGTSFWIVSGPSCEPIGVIENRCAHMGGKLTSTKNGFTCMTHGWTYKNSGENRTPMGPGVEKIEFRVDGDNLELFFEQFHPILLKKGEVDGSETLDLLAHASFLVSAHGKRVLFDPWLFGPTYWGSWSHFPSREIDPLTIVPTDIIITHPHPDHFHPETLEYFDRDVRIYIPNFQSQLMQAKLQSMGFTQVVTVPWEKPLSISEDIEVAFLRPMSHWEDSSVLVRVRDWIWLNQNDSGAALRDELIPRELDLLSTSFDTGASSYPLNWDMAEGRKTQILKSSKIQLMNTIRQRCEALSPKFFSPSAGWWRHGLEEHSYFSENLPHTSFDDLEEALSDLGTVLLETIPSSRIFLSDMRHEWDPSVRSNLDVSLQATTKSIPDRSFSDAELHSAVDEHLDRLSKLSTAARSEPVLFRVVVTGLDFISEKRFGNLEVLPLVTLNAEISPWVAELLVSGEPTAIWNHVDIGYWVKWSRDPDIFPANFMRLLQLGRVSRLESSPELEIERSQNIERTAIATFIDKDPELARAILSRAGLPCVACTKSNADNLGDAFKIHRVPEKLSRLAKSELTALLSS